MSQPAAARAPDADPPAPDVDPAGADASDTRPVDVHPVLPADLTAGPVCRRRVPVRGGTLAVAEIGEPTAPAWVLAHGVGSSARFVAAAFADAVVAAGGRLVVHDLRGHGGSVTAPDVADHHLDVHVADLAAVVAATAGAVAATAGAVGATAGAGQPGGGPAVVGGISLGGHAAVRLVSGGAVTPEVVLACLPAWTGAATPGEGPHAAVAAQVAAIGIDGILAQLRDDRALAGWLRRTLVTDYARHDPASLEAALCALDGGDAPSEAELAGLTVPLAVMAWPQDPGHPLAVAERWVALAPRAALGTVTIGELEAGVARLGRAAVAAVTDLSSVRG
jgi:pimeloyl-ACP methyl ester carboxylesterase